LKKYAAEIAGKVDCVAMLEARGFLLGTLMALHLNVPCVPVRKKGKLPGKVAQLEYSLEYAKVIINCILFYVCVCTTHENNRFNIRFNCVLFHLIK